MTKRRTSSLLLLAAALGACGDNASRGAILGFADEPAGDRCPAGGTRIDAGRDDDGDGTLDAEEVETTTYVCDGADGADGEDGEEGPQGDQGTPGQNGQPGQPGEDGHDVLIAITAEPPGAHCVVGGQRVDTGLDLDDDGVLDASEITSTAYLCDGDDGDPAVAGFRVIAKYTTPAGPIAEIVAASPDGLTLAYTSSSAGTVGFVDLTEPLAPLSLGDVSVAAAVSGGDGEPTAVAITPDGQYAVVTVKDTGDPIASADPGALVFIRMSDRTIAGQVALGVGPDSLKITPDGTRAVIAIEDEENADANAVAQARPGSVQVVMIDAASPSASTVATIALTPPVGNMPTDPQPEYVDITPDSRTAIVTLQENNVIAIVDLTTSTVARYLDAGSSIHARADLTTNGVVDFSATMVAQLQPDAACLIAGGSHFLTANEGDTPNGSFGAGVYSGGRGFSVFSVTGGRVYDSGDALQWAALRAGAYPENRSGNRGVEPEGCGAGEFGGAEYAFVTGERDSALFVIDVTTPSQPVIRQVLGAPMRPESVTTIASRGLVIVGGEGNGTGGGIWIYEAVSDPADAGNGVDAYALRSDAIPFSALGALAYDPATQLILATPDNIVAGQRIWSFWVDHGARRWHLVNELILRDAAGAPLTGYDPEGLALRPDGGYVIASEGVAANGGSTTCVGSAASNRLLFFTADGRLDPAVSGDGIVELPCGAEPGAIDWTTVRSNGYEGVAAVDATPGVPGGVRVYVAMQRALTTEGQATRIGEYDVDAGTWRWWFYTLDANPGGAAGSTFLSELIHVAGDKFAVVERDHGWAGAAGNKTIRVFRLSTGTPGVIGDPVDKALAEDLLDHPFRFDQEKIEGLALGAGALWVTSDNDGGQAPTYALKLDPAVLDIEAGGVGPTPGQADVVINEVATTPTDYVELFNRGAAPVSVAGWKLTDSDPTHVYELPPGTTIAPGGRLLIEHDTSTAPLHLTFGLGSADAITLLTPTNATVDTYAWTSHVSAASRCPEGTGTAFWAPTPPTPGAANDCTPPPVAGQDDVVINEVNSSGADFLELMNTGAAAVDVSGWKITDNDPTHLYVLPAGTSIPAGGLLLIEGDGSTAPLHLTFGLGSADAAIVYTPYDVVVDQHAWTAHVASASRCADGTGAFLAGTAATPGALNACP
jgi:hypothetical protein